MRTSALLLLLFIFLGSAFAADQLAASSDQQQVAAPFLTMGPNDEVLNLRFLARSEATCLKLRTYVVRRIERNSDVTRLHSYTTCTPAWKFQTRSAVQRQTPALAPKVAY